METWKTKIWSRHRNICTHTCVYLHSDSHRILPLLQLDKQCLKRFRRNSRHNWITLQLRAMRQRAFSLKLCIIWLVSYFGKTWVGKIGAAVFAAATIALIAIGVFNEHYSGTHYAVSVAFFTLMPISMFIITCAFLLAHRGRMALFTVSTGVAAALPWILLFAFKYVPNVAIPEFISGLIVSAWTIILGYKML